MRVNEGIIQEATASLSNFAKSKKIIESIDESEPEFMRWARTATREDTQKLLDMMALNPHAAETVQNMMMKARVSSFFIYHAANMREWEVNHNLTPELVTDAEKVYNEWITGRLPKQFYSSSPKKRTPEFKAKKAFMREEKRKKKFLKSIKEHEDRMNTLKTAGITEDEVNKLAEVPYLLQYGVID